MPAKGAVVVPGALDRIVPCKVCGKPFERTDDEIMLYRCKCRKCWNAYKRELRARHKSGEEPLARTCTECDETFYLASHVSPDTLCPECWERGRATRLTHENIELRAVLQQLRKENTELKQVVNPTTEEQWIKRAKYLQRKVTKVVKRLRKGEAGHEALP